MGRKLFDAIIIVVTLVFLGFVLASISPSYATSNVAYASDSDTSSSNYRIFVRMQPEKANSSDLKFWEGSDVRIKLEMYDLRDNPIVIRKKSDGTQDQQPPTKIIDHVASGFKILYVWDNLDTTRVIEYQDVFQPLDGEHWLFAYAVNSDGIFQTPATKFLVQWRLNPVHVVPTMSQVYVSPEYVSWGKQGNQSNQGEQILKVGQITEEATSTQKIISPIPSVVSQNNIFNSLKEKFSNLFFESRNIWIGLLVVGLILLVVAKLLFRGGKK
jgi:hypothetical protein